MSACIRAFEFSSEIVKDLCLVDTIYAGSLVRSPSEANSHNRIPCCWKRYFLSFTTDCKVFTNV